MIYVRDLSHSFGDKVIFDSVSVAFKDRCRVGIVGNNGTGKTTLLRMISGIQDYDKGNIEIIGKRRVDMLEQDIIDLPDLKVLDYLKERTGITELEIEMKRLEKELQKAHEDDYDQLLLKFQEASDRFTYLEGYNFTAICGRVLKGLGFRDSDLEKNCNEFSGGLKTRIGLAYLLISKPDIMLLDEPTNHLDTESMEWLESYLKDYPGSIITVSHDIRFQDKITTETYEIFNGKINTFSGNYSYYIVEKERRLEALKKELETQAKEIKQIEDFIERFRYKASKAAQVQSRIKMLERFKEIKIEGNAKSVNLKFNHSTQSGQSVIKLDNVGHNYGNYKVFENVNLELTRGEKVAVVGVNGAGKSTLSAIIAGYLEQTMGERVVGHKVIPAYFSQSSSDSLNKENTIFEEINTVKTSMVEGEKRDLLGAFLFSGADINKKIGVLSGGERSRVALIKLLMNDTNFLILDEPTNHLDRSTKEIFQKALLEYAGTILIVSHDRYFLDKLAGRIIEVKDGKIKDYVGDYSYFIWKREQDSEIQPQEMKKDTKAVESVAENNTGYKSKEQKRIEAEKRKELNQKTKKIREAIVKSESDIEKFENLKQSFENDLCNPDILTDGEKVVTLNIKLKETIELLENEMSNWEELTIQLEEILEEEK
ncbi:MAG: ABC-F family ATP-binding cassette domain-containing protein [Candidatus Delongbacteria bacterium]|nr:ABC-F family ATP-binding cassette domain-containing protein [Candidatus Delongbacteria bacterium]MBN2835417.1 ABC-F family ATP-binding cassette domain-containing protein [Candidatus Delongbacteria bacterium]